MQSDGEIKERFNRLLNTFMYTYRNSVVYFIYGSHFEL